MFQQHSGVLDFIFDHRPNLLEEVLHVLDLLLLLPDLLLPERLVVAHQPLQVPLISLQSFNLIVVPPFLFLEICSFEHADEAGAGRVAVVEVAVVEVEVVDVLLIVLTNNRKHSSCDRPRAASGGRTE